MKRCVAGAVLAGLIWWDAAPAHGVAAQCFAAREGTPQLLSFDLQPESLRFNSWGAGTPSLEMMGIAMPPNVYENATIVGTLGGSAVFADQGTLDPADDILLITPDLGVDQVIVQVETEVVSPDGAVTKKLSDILLGGVNVVTPMPPLPPGPWPVQSGTNDLPQSNAQIDAIIDPELQKKRESDDQAARSALPGEVTTTPNGSTSGAASGGEQSGTAGASGASGADPTRASAGETAGAGAGAPGSEAAGDAAVPTNSRAEANTAGETAGGNSAAASAASISACIPAEVRSVTVRPATGPLVLQPSDAPAAPTEQAQVPDDATAPAAAPEQQAGGAGASAGGRRVQASERSGSASQPTTSVPTPVLVAVLGLGAVGVVAILVSTVRRLRV